MPPSLKQSSREIALRKYFAKAPPLPSYAGAILLIVLGCVTLIAGLMLLNKRNREVLTYTVPPGALMIVLGAALVYGARSSYLAALEKISPQPSDREVDAWRDQGLAKLVAHSYGILA